MTLIPHLEPIATISALSVRVMVFAAAAMQLFRERVKWAIKQITVCSQGEKDIINFHLTIAFKGKSKYTSSLTQKNTMVIFHCNKLVFAIQDALRAI